MTSRNDEPTFLDAPYVAIGLLLFLLGFIVWAAL